MSKKLITLLLFGIFANGAFAVDTIPISQNVQMQQQNSAVEDEDDDMISLGDDEVSSS